MFSILFSVVFNDCRGKTRVNFMSTDTRFNVDSDGTIKVKRQVSLHNGHKIFLVYAWDSKGKKHFTLVKVEHQDRAENHQVQQQDVNTIKSSLVHQLLECNPPVMS